MEESGRKWKIVGESGRECKRVHECKSAKEGGGLVRRKKREEGRGMQWEEEGVKKKLEETDIIGKTR